ncbi:redoxin family protein [Blastopirellula sp. JC732]|uniref:Redoxin family protein n=1 Tax=Blastopirellula sediminis TaxID=2894196 RepID=A0A9X1MLP6_9BACT|nr:redoxin family protein [Blastopirellula sediminis]MCC9608693.1 redoxin family protein [Blastopirellula sediminis]MCC9628530.1 redoxin family protein [Blastopirellula sediminis]
MKITHLALAALLLAMLPTVSLLNAAEAAAAEDQESASGLYDALKADPNDQSALNAYLQATISPAMKQSVDDPKGALKQLEEVKKALSELEPTAPLAVANFRQMDRTLDALIQRVELQQISLNDLRAQLDAAKQDVSLIGKYSTKVMMELSTEINEDWQKAEKTLDAETAYLKSLAESAETDEAKAAIQGAQNMISRLVPNLERQKKLAELIGKPAMPLSAQAWVNGAPLTDDELKGKVVLLDFFAIWCGPCIMSFPHLRELNEEFGDKGLVIIGVTGYYNYGWNEEKMAPEPVRGDMVSAEEEQAMLHKFAEKYELKHVFAVDPEGTMSKYYAVSGIPHMVLIDQEGKIAMVKVGFGEANSKALTAEIKKLLGAN